MTFDLAVSISLLYYIFVIEGYEPRYSHEPMIIGLCLPICIKLIAWGKDGYKND